MKIWLRYKVHVRYILMIAVMLGTVAGIISVLHSITYNIQQQIIAQAQPALWWDIVVSSTSVLPDDIGIFVLQRDPQARMSRTISYITNTSWGQLIRVLWVDSAYPLFGSVVIQSWVFDPNGVWTTLDDIPSSWILLEYPWDITSRFTSQGIIIQPLDSIDIEFGARVTYALAIASKIDLKKDLDAQYPELNIRDFRWLQWWLGSALDQLLVYLWIVWYIVLISGMISVSVVYTMMARKRAEVKKVCTLLGWVVSDYQFLTLWFIWFGAAIVSLLSILVVQYIDPTRIWTREWCVWVIVWGVLMYYRRWLFIPVVIYWVYSYGFVIGWVIVTWVLGTLAWWLRWCIGFLSRYFIRRIFVIWDIFRLLSRVWRRWVGVLLVGSVTLIWALTITQISRSFVSSLQNTFLNQPSTYILNLSGLAPDILTFPIIWSRIVSINNQPFWSKFQRFDREYNISVSGFVQSGSVSIDRDFAGDIGAKIWDMLTISIVGRPFTVRISDIRSSVRRWATPFFYLLVNPEQFSLAPRTYFGFAQKSLSSWDIATLRQSNPQATIIDVSALVKQVFDVVNQILDINQLIWILASIALTSTFLIMIMIISRYATQSTRIYTFLWWYSWAWRYALYAVVLWFGLVIAWVWGTAIFVRISTAYSWIILDRASWLISIMLATIALIIFGFWRHKLKR